MLPLYSTKGKPWSDSSELGSMGIAPTKSGLCLNSLYGAMTTSHLGKSDVYCLRQEPPLEERGGEPLAVVGI